MKVAKTKKGISLGLTVDEAIALEAVLGGITGPVAREVPWYDAIADVLEKHLDPPTISKAIQDRYHHFQMQATFWNGKDFAPDPARQVKK